MSSHRPTQHRRREQAICSSMHAGRRRRRLLGAPNSIVVVVFGTYRRGSGESNGLIQHHKAAPSSIDRSVRIYVCTGMLHTEYVRRGSGWLSYLWSGCGGLYSTFRWDCCWRPKCWGAGLDSHKRVGRSLPHRGTAVMCNTMHQHSTPILPTNKHLLLE